MPQWAGSCWYYLRYIDPRNPAAFVDPEKEKAWMPVDLYVGGTEHAVLHLLYARFWHKVLYDIGAVSTPEPFRRLVNQGMILGEMEYTLFRDAAGNPLSFASDATAAAAASSERLPDADVLKKGDKFVWKQDPSVVLRAKAEKMSKSRGNVINPDDIVRQYGADSLRLYEMFMGPLTQVKPWSMKGVEGVSRFLNRVWRLFVDPETGETLPPCDDTPTPGQLRALHTVLKAVTRDIEAMAYNTAISAMMIFLNEALAWPNRPRAALEPFVLVLSPFAPHIAEEIWQRLGHAESLARAPWPEWDEAHLKQDLLTLPVQVNGKLRARITVPADASPDAVLAAAEASPEVLPFLAGKPVRKRIHIPGRLVNLVV
jgi:leucyl-tRNA synthetase